MKILQIVKSGNSSQRAPRLQTCVVLSRPEYLWQSLQRLLLENLSFELETKYMTKCFVKQHREKSENFSTFHPRCGSSEWREPRLEPKPRHCSLQERVLKKKRTDQSPTKSGQWIRRQQMVARRYSKYHAQSQCWFNAAAWECIGCIWMWLIFGIAVVWFKLWHRFISRKSNRSRSKPQCNRSNRLYVKATAWFYGLPRE